MTDKAIVLLIVVDLEVELLPRCCPRANTGACLRKNIVRAPEHFLRSSLRLVLSVFRGNIKKTLGEISARRHRKYPLFCLCSVSNDRSDERYPQYLSFVEIADKKLGVHDNLGSCLLIGRYLSQSSSSLYRGAESAYA